MRRGRVYLWTPDPTLPLGGSLRSEVVELPRLERGPPLRLSGKWVSVHNAGHARESDEAGEAIRSFAIGDAQPDEAGDFLFNDGRGGGRMDKNPLPNLRFAARYVEAAHFGEVNAYFHLDRGAQRLNELLFELGAAPLPQVVVWVNAHDAHQSGDVCDGVRGTRQWLPFQGGHYRLSRRPYGPCEHHDVLPTGEIHLGPGWRVLTHGALVEHAGRSYRANAAHNAGILYHELAHHLTRHTADFQGNARRAPEQQSNVKCALDEAVADYFAASMLETPHIWALHQRHDSERVHPRSLSIRRRFSDYDARPQADPHTNGSIFASALWRVREQVSATDALTCDRLLVAALLELGEHWQIQPARALRDSYRSPAAFGVGLRALLQADARIHLSRHRATILQTFAEQGIEPAATLSSESTEQAPVRVASRARAGACS